jgi:dTDP-4-amino-4,6-dideoxygalactose transaminase
MKNYTVSQPSLPPFDEFVPVLKDIWNSKVLTNNGPFHKKFEEELCNYLEVPFISVFCNATIALITALQALDVKGEVVTTPYSFVATAHSLMWNGIKPVFIDIDPITMNLDPSKIEMAITEETTAIMPVHCYGNPCDMDRIQSIADKYKLKVIYDAAHAFGVRQNNQSILNAGNLSILSFHATKVFNTFEGGAIISPDATTKKYIDNLKNFGFENETSVVTLGINGKMSEFNAALGLLQLDYIQDNIVRRKEIDILYRKLLADIPGVSMPIIPNTIEANYSYFPILVNGDYKINRDALYFKLKEKGINARRYFYPLITDFKPYKNLSQRWLLPNAVDLSARVICLPIYPGLSETDIEFITSSINTFFIN